MKKYWHTKTLFIQPWTWKYKWSYKFEHCVECLTCNFKHKGRWLCTSCWDKERKAKKKRSIKLKIASRRFSFRKRIKFWLENQPKKKWPRPFLESEKKTRKEIAQDYYKKNKEVLNIKGAVWRRRQKGLFCMQANFGWKIVFLPFESLEKPKKFDNPNYEKEYEIWRKNLKDFEILKSFYFKK